MSFDLLCKERLQILFFCFVVEGMEIDELKKQNADSRYVSARGSKVGVASYLFKPAKRPRHGRTSHITSR